MQNGKQWIRETLAHEETGAVPYNFMFSPQSLRLATQHYGPGDIAETLQLPIRMTGCKSIKPLYADPAEFGETAADEFGVVWSTNAIDRGAPVGPCLPEPDLSGYRFPDAAAPHRFEDIGRWCEKSRGNYTIIWVGDLWERATFMRGMVNILEDVALRPEFVQELLQRIGDFILKTMAILFERFEFDGVALSDDYGTQKAMIISPSCWRSLVKPVLARVCEFAKDHERTVFLHSCGNILPIIGDLIEIGLDILHPIQPEAMDVFALKKEFGRDLTFCGGLRTQDLLPRGTPEQVREEVRRLKEKMGEGGGYILEPGITIQADVPLENLVAMIEEARKPL